MHISHFIKNVSNSFLSNILRRADWFLYILLIFLCIKLLHINHVYSLIFVIWLVRAFPPRTPSQRSTIVSPYNMTNCARRVYFTLYQNCLQFVLTHVYNLIFHYILVHGYIRCNPFSAVKPAMHLPSFIYLISSLFSVVFLSYASQINLIATQTLFSSIILIRKRWLFTVSFVAACLRIFLLFFSLLIDRSFSINEKYSKFLKQSHRCRNPSFMIFPIFL